MKYRYAIIGASVGILIFAASLHYASASGAQNITPTFTTSRFMILSGTYSIVPELKGEAVRNENGVFRLDTYTGKTWKLTVGQNQEGRRIEQWVSIEDK